MPAAEAQPRRRLPLAATATNRGGPPGRPALADAPHEPISPQAVTIPRTPYRVRRPRDRGPARRGSSSGLPGLQAFPETQGTVGSVGGERTFAGGTTMLDLSRAAALIGALCTVGWLPAHAQETAVRPSGATRVPSDNAAADAIYERRTVIVKRGNDAVSFGWRLLRPATIEPGRSYPVVLFLHGAGERGDDNVRQLKYLPTWMTEPANRDTYPCFVIAPQCRGDSRWVDVAWAARESSAQAASPTTDMAAAIAALDEVLAGEPADQKRIYLTGLSMGGFGTWDLAARMPERFAAILPICGGYDERTAPRLVSLPTWVAHGDADAVVPVERSRSMVAALKAAGGDPTYVEMPGVGHDSWTPTYRDPAALAWLFGQRRTEAR
jgi:predicted peptidase